MYNYKRKNFALTQIRYTIITGALNLFDFDLAVQNEFYVDYFPSYLDTGFIIVWEVCFDSKYFNLNLFLFKKSLFRNIQLIIIILNKSYLGPVCCAGTYWNDETSSCESNYDI